MKNILPNQNPSQNRRELTKRLFELLRFGFVGVLNTLLDAFVLNSLLLITSKQELIFYSLFKGVSFFCAVVFSFFMNRFFVFRKDGDFKPFLIVSLVGAGFNVAFATLVSAVSCSIFHVSSFILCANIGFLGGALATIIWNYLGYKFFVFTKNKSQVPNIKSQT